MELCDCDPPLEDDELLGGGVDDGGWVLLPLPLDGALAPEVEGVDTVEPGEPEEPELVEAGGVVPSFMQLLSAVGGIFSHE